MKTYSTRTNAIRAARQEYGAEAQATIDFVVTKDEDGRFGYAPVSKSVAVEIAPTPAMVATVTFGDKLPDPTPEQVEQAVTAVKAAAVKATIKIDDEPERDVLLGTGGSVAALMDALKSGTAAVAPTSKKGKAEAKKKAKAPRVDPIFEAGRALAPYLVASPANAKQYQPKFDALLALAQKAAVEAAAYTDLVNTEIGGANSYAKMLRRYRAGLVAKLDEVV